jgi:hypothetical protein
MLFALALPFIAYGLYAAWRGRTGLRDPGLRDPWPTTILLLAGAALAAETLAVTALDEPRIRDERYVPAHLDNGRLVPGQFVPEPQIGPDQ